MLFISGFRRSSLQSSIFFNYVCDTHCIQGLPKIRSAERRFVKMLSTGCERCVVFAWYDFEFTLVKFPPFLR